ncbi:MAG: hypothetical protein CL916_03335 [Deltaproteobacteria bacterium]|nr:hypothetical protein [Deltaproteobacteria bacterium]
MQEEIFEQGYDIYILGINQVGFEIANEQVTEERNIPWLQDQESVLMWDEWEVQYRDVLIFDESLTIRTVINLSQFDLRDENNYSSMFNTLTTL